MPLDPGLDQLLAAMVRYDMMGLARGGTAEQARSGFHAVTAGARPAELVIPVGGTQDGSLPGPAGPLAYRVYRPESSAAKLPTILFLHGGGWVIGSIDTHDNQARRLCREVGAVVVSVNYRLAPEDPFPAGVEDAWAALQWVAGQLMDGEFGADPDRLVVAGDSAGANLSAVIARRARDARRAGSGPLVAAQLLLYPGTDFVGDHPSRQENAENLLLTLNDILWFAEQYVGAAQQAGTLDLADPDLSPLHAPDLSDLPHAIVVTAEFDPLRDEGEAYARALEAAGTPVTAVRMDGMIHGFFDLGPVSPGVEQAVQRTCTLLADVLAGSPAASVLSPGLPTDDVMPAWERRFRSGRTSLPSWAEDAPDRCVVVATTEGVLELHSWTASSGEMVQLTSRPEGTSDGAIDPAGEWIWWFDDDAGSEHGRWLKQPYRSAPGESVQDATGLPAAYSAGLALGAELAIIGSTDEGYGTRIDLVATGSAAGSGPEPGEARRLYEHTEDAIVGDLSQDDELLAIVHSEHGDSRHPAVRVLRVCDGSTVADLWDGEGKGLEVMGFPPIAGDSRLLIQHERHGRPELLIWEPFSGEETPLELEIEGEISEATWFRDGTRLLLAVDHEARTRLYIVELDPLSATAVGRADGTVLGAAPRPDGEVWTLWSSAALPPAVRNLAGNVILAAPGDPAPESVSIEDVWVEGKGGRIHALLRRPPGPKGPLPLFFDIHGGPTWHDSDAFRAYPSAWVDHGFAVVQVNYRGSTGYGSAWRDALEERVGHIELEDVVAVRDHLVATGVADGAKVVLSGASWGGFLTLLGIGVHPDRWAVGVAGVPVADYVAAYEDEMEGLKAFDRALFGGSPTEVPDRYRDSSPLTYIDDVTAPVFVLAGENDPRCPIRQIDNYLDALAKRGRPYGVYRYDAGHGSLVDDERVTQFNAELTFVTAHLPS